MGKRGERKTKAKSMTSRNVLIFILVINYYLVERRYTTNTTSRRVWKQWGEIDVVGGESGRI
jgi:hypothetical protein